jgi:hypothetical protein
MKLNSERRFSVEQDRSYSGEWINEKTKWANTKVNLIPMWSPHWIPMWTVYEQVGIPSYETPVFHGTELSCLDWIKQQSI